MEGIFTISLDFELHWGVFDKRDRQAREACYRNTLRIIPTLLELFSKYDVHVTWATVGSLFAHDRQEWEQLKPCTQPDYINEKYSAYKWVEQHGLHDRYRWAHFAPESVAAILQYPGQELGTHTFSHYYCLEGLNGEDAFGADLQAANRAAAKLGAKMKSLVFPRNQFNPNNLKACIENSIEVVRTNPDTWFWSPIANDGSSLLRKVFRTGDAYVPMGSGRMSYPLGRIAVRPGEPLQLPASRLLRPWSPQYKIANQLGLRRVMQELKTAAQQKECYHLWWHPENFGDYPEQNLEMLETVLKKYKEYKSRYGMKSWNMGEYAEHLLGDETKPATHSKVHTPPVH